LIYIGTGFGKVLTKPKAEGIVWERGSINSYKYSYSPDWSAISELVANQYTLMYVKAYSTWDS